MTASLLVMVVFALALRLQGELSLGAHFLGVTAGSWSVLVLIGSVLATAWVAWRCLPTSGGAMDAFVHAPLLGALCGYFVLALRSDFWWLAPLVAAANIVFLIAALPRCTAAGWRITHAALAQIQLSVAAWWSVEHFELDLHGQFCVLLLSVVLPQAARLVLSRSRGAAVSGELRVIGLGILVGLPLLLLAYAVGPQTDRGTVLLSLLLWLGYALLAHWAFGAGPYRQWLLLPVSLAVAALAIVPAATFGSTTGWSGLDGGAPPRRCGCSPPRRWLPWALNGHTAGNRPPGNQIGGVAGAAGSHAGLSARTALAGAGLPDRRGWLNPAGAYPADGAVLGGSCAIAAGGRGHRPAGPALGHHGE